MKTLFAKCGKSIYVADKEKCIFRIDDIFYDKTGNETAYSIPCEDTKTKNDIICQGTKIPLFPRSVTEIEWEIDDGFGNFGFVDSDGKFVIEPQYAYAHEFTMGLAAVNLNRTWYTSENGNRYYENHFGYIDGNGKTVIGFKFDEANPFNKYGIALVSELEKGWYLIDVSGNEIPETRFGCISKFYYHERYAEISGDDCEDAMGIYDTKERNLLVDISDDIDGMIEWDEEHILIYTKDKSGHPGVFYQHYIDSNGSILYPWMYRKGFNIVKIPDENNISAVARFEFSDYTGKTRGYYVHEGKKYSRKEMYGLYSSKEEFLMPMVYDDIQHLHENIWACFKDGVITVVETEYGD